MFRLCPWCVSSRLGFRLDVGRERLDVFGRGLWFVGSVLGFRFDLCGCGGRGSLEALDAGGWRRQWLRRRRSWKFGTCRFGLCGRGGRRLVAAFEPGGRWGQFTHFVASRHVEAHTSAPRKKPTSMHGIAMIVEIMPSWLPRDQETAPRARASGPRMIGTSSKLVRAQTSPATPSCLPSSVSAALAAVTA